ncbi:DUF5060 domain-containing protein [Synoicihabitans lomoniglobus]|uniref:DUF5060 domain-containing protein n=1 Tax=Synoicihabitans lomoniglobus TaxID=2909285 RepID=A0AAF0I5E9_9BACT|nr:DUF4038 domain-containing protein [Opitutaceae bacterium LMO-M01]WED67259.1 DUF5060 domain-containing protein [Opitutaceae bacterium LMO-M01]
MPSRSLRRLFGVLLSLTLFTPLTRAVLQSGEVHVWELQEIQLQASGDYANPYADVTCWIDLEGPGFAKRVYGFWDGGQTFRVRFVAPTVGEWTWTTGSNQADDNGLNSGQGSLRAVAWTDAELAENPNRRGFVRATPNGRALQYADGAPFFWLGDTWLAGATWRLPVTGRPAAADYVPGPGISFEEAVAWRKRQGFNSVSLIAAFPNWAADHRGATYANADGVYLRNAWEKFGHWAARGEITTADGAITTGKDMHDELGNRPFEVFDDRDGLADFDRIVPAYFRSLDRKMAHLSDEGFVPFLETIRRDNAPAWKAYFDFNESYARFVQYLISRYGAYNMVFSGIHLDWIPENYSLTEQEFNEALTYHHAKYGPMPFGQPYTTLIDSTTYRRFGHGDDCPWLTMHTVGNKPRNHAIYDFIEESFHLPNPYPVANLEPYYAGWNHDINRPGGETPDPGSPRDDYFARAQMYGSVLSGGLAGHVYGTAAYDVTSTGEPAGWRPHIWTALRYRSGGQMQHLRDFVLSAGDTAYTELIPASDDLHPRKSPHSIDDGLDGWSFMMRAPAGDAALLYFEMGAVGTTLHGLRSAQNFQWRWFNPRTGEWGQPIHLRSDADGHLASPDFPAGGQSRETTVDWAAQLSPRS